MYIGFQVILMPSHEPNQACMHSAFKVTHDFHDFFISSQTVYPPRQPSKVVAHDAFKLLCLRVDLIDTIPSANIGSNWIPSMESMQYTHCLRREPSCYTVECTNQVDHASCGMNPSYDMQWKMLHYRLPGQH